jgi:UDP-N-acetylmuramyl-tripeptide synthetase
VINKKLPDILNGVEVNLQDGRMNLGITGVTTDSKEVKEGFVFIAVKGSHYDGHNFIKEAIEKGANVIVSQEDFFNVADKKEIVKILVGDSRTASADIIHNFYGRPADAMKMIGITGTNGKTTVSYLTEGILKEAGFNVGVIGTINYRYNLRQIPATNTTPGVLQLVKMLSYMAANAANYAIMEVSSHSLEQNRVRCINFKTAVFTNITPEHLDYHKDMLAYKNAKAMLFKGLSKNSTAVLNVDDDFGKELSTRTPATTLKCSLLRKADITAEKFSFSPNGAQMIVNTPNGKMRIETRLAGRFNVYNILAAIGVGIAENVDSNKIISGIEKLKVVPGRLEEIFCGQPFRVYVDYAHTDDALKNILTSLKDFNPNRIITLFGCGGDRDVTKRPRMGEVASRLSDYVVITTDNPRNEDSAAIAEQITKGIEKNRLGRAFVMLDRRQAIKKAISLAAEGDIVLLAGKGHETYQILKNMIQPFDDREVAKEALSDLGYSSLCLR